MTGAGSEMQSVDSPRPLTQAALQGGVDLFNRGEYFAAHEAWEDIWRTVGGDERRFLQGLIQCAVALEHARRGNVRGALRMADRFPAKFAGLPRVYMGIDIDDLLARMRHALDAIQTGRNGMPPPIITFPARTLLAGLDPNPIRPRPGVTGPLLG